MEVCGISGQPYDECDGYHEGECVCHCGNCGGNVYNCICPDPIPHWALDPRRSAAQSTINMISVSKIHLAGEPVGLVQRCSICGEILQDYRNSLSVGDWQPHWWSGSVEVSSSGGMMWSTKDAPNCEAKVVVDSA